MELESILLEIVQGLWWGGGVDMTHHIRGLLRGGGAVVCVAVMGFRDQGLGCRGAQDTSEGPWNTTDFDATSALK